MNDAAANDSATPTGGAASAAGGHVWMLRLVVFVAGLTTMATEMAAARLLAPYFGASTLVWANVIGLILIYLSVGYWWGGRLADKYHSFTALSNIAIFAAIGIAIVPIVADPVLGFAVSGLDNASASILIGSFLGTLLLFVAPITLLGMVPPFAMRLSMRDVDHSGSVAGTLYALSTVGSIVGTYLAVLLLIPGIGTRRTFITLALVLMVVALLVRVRRPRWAVGAAVVTAILLIMPVGLVKPNDDGEILFEGESLYQFVQVVEREQGLRVLHLNEGWAVHSAWNPLSTLTNSIWDHFLLLPDLADIPEEGKLLIVGNAAGSAARSYAEFRPEWQIDGVEIDPLVSEVGRKYFEMGSENNLTVHTADGRPFLEGSDDTWNVIHIDAYRQPYIPFYLTTREFFELVREHLAPGGIVSVNVGITPRDDRVKEAVAATMRDVFPEVVEWRAEEFNDMVLGATDPQSLTAYLSRVRTSTLPDEEPLNRVRQAFLQTAREVQPGEAMVMTDDRAPVEWMTDRMIVGYGTAD